MATSSAELLRNYATIVAEAQMGEEEPQPDLDVEPGLEGEEPNSQEEESDYDDMDNDESPTDVSDDPIKELSAAIAAELDHGDRLEDLIHRTIHSFLESNNYELTPINGLTNNMGKL